MFSVAYTKKKRKIVLVAKASDVPFKCDVCRKIFISDPYLRRHYERRHPNCNVPKLPSVVEVYKWPDKKECDSVNTVPNVSQRIEHLLSNLTCEDELDKTFDVPLANSTLTEINEEPLDSYKKSESKIEFSSSSTDSSVAADVNKFSSGECTEKSFESNGMAHASEKKSYLNCLDSKEKELAERLISPIQNEVQQGLVESCESLHLNHLKAEDSPVRLNGNNEEISETMAIKSRLRTNVISKLNSTLRRYGVDPNWESIPDTSAKNIERVLKTNRDAFREHNPNYDRIRDLINHNVNRRIQMSLENIKPEYF